MIHSRCCQIRSLNAVRGRALMGVKIAMGRCRSRLSEKMPLHLVWSLTNACNARCIHCYASSARRSPGELSRQEVLKGIDECARDGLLDLALSGGEPLLVGDLEFIVEHAASVGLTVWVGTGGWALTARRARNLASPGISRVQVSLDGLAEAHDRIRQREGLFSRAHRAIENSRSVNIKTRARFADRRGNVNEMGQVFEFCRSAGVDGFNLSQLVPAGRGDRFNGSSP